MTASGSHIRHEVSAGVAQPAALFDSQGFPLESQDISGGAGTAYGLKTVAVDASGNVIASGGAGAVSVADGSDVTQGAKADAAVTDPTASASAIALLKGHETLLGSLTETAPATDTASSGLNGRAQRIAQRLTSLIALLPASLGQKLMAASFPVTLASDQTVIPVSDNSGSLTVDGTVTASNTAGDVAAGSADSGNPVKVGGKYNSTKPTLTNGQRGDQQLEINGTHSVALYGKGAAAGDQPVVVIPTGSVTNLSYGTGTLTTAITAYDGTGSDLRLIVNNRGFGDGNTVNLLSTGLGIFNGTNWDRVRTAVSDALAATGLMAAGNMLWNGATWDRAKGDSTGAARSSLYAKVSAAGDTALISDAAGNLGVAPVNNGGYSNALTITRPANTTAYTANDVVGGALSFTSMGPSAGRIIITSVQLEYDVAAIPSGMTSFTLYLYNVTPPSATADNGAWDLPSGDRASYLGSIALGSPVDLGSTLYVETNGVNKQVKLSGTGLFGYLVTAGGYTPNANSETVIVTLHAVAV